MSSLDEIRKTRLQKLEALKARGSDPYPAESGRTLTVAEALARFGELEKSARPETLAGRVMTIRPQGGLIFFNFKDGTGALQGLFKRDEMEADVFDTFAELVDMGDFAEFTGKFFTTQRGEKTLKVSGWKMLAKSLLPLPEKWHGLRDTEEKLRKRYLDLLLDDEARALFEKKAKFWDTVRKFMKDREFLEVETPTLEITTGGAEANPFKTHHDDLDLDLYLRISVGELWQKRLMSAGFPKTFEIGRAYRNEGSSAEHLQEFTNMEFYASYMNIDEGKKLVQELYREIAKGVFGATKFSARGFDFDLAGEWPEIDYTDEVKKLTGIDIFASSEKEMKNKLIELGVKFDGESKERLIDNLWKYCRRKIAGPVFLVNHPKIVAPLSKTLKSDERKTDMFQVIIAGTEMGRAHAELNDPIDQADRFARQRELIKKGDKEAMMEDKEFVEMLEHGMPPCFGFGFGERLFAFMADKPVRETQTFPLLRPKK